MNYFTLLIVASMFVSSINCDGMQQARVIGGENAPDNKYPYQVSLQYKLPPNSLDLPTSPDGWIHICGGSIITEKHVLSAANCITSNFTVNDFSIFAGTTQLDGNGTRFLIQKYLNHPDYAVSGKSNICIVYIKKYFRFTEKILPINFSSKVYGNDVFCTLTGWGFTSMRPVGRVPNDLQQVMLQVISKQDCQRLGQNIGQSELCTLATAGHGACVGDSGGPLATDNNLVGIVSFAPVRCGTLRPNVFTRVSSFYSWIEENIK